MVAPGPDNPVLGSTAWKYGMTVSGTSWIVNSAYYPDSSNTYSAFMLLVEQGKVASGGYSFERLSQVVDYYAAGGDSTVTQYFPVGDIEVYGDGTARFTDAAIAALGGVTFGSGSYGDKFNQLANLRQIAPGIYTVSQAKELVDLKWSGSQLQTSVGTTTTGTTTYTGLTTTYQESLNFTGITDSQIPSQPSVSTPPTKEIGLTLLAAGAIAYIFRKQLRRLFKR